MNFIRKLKTLQSDVKKAGPLQCKKRHQIILKAIVRLHKSNVIKSPKHLWDIQKWEKWFFSHLTLEWVIIRRQCTTPVAAHLMIQTCSDLCLIWQETAEQFSYHMRSCLLRYLQNSQEINHLWATANLSLPMKSSRTHRWESCMNRQNLLEIIHVKIRIRKEFSSPQWFSQ